MRRIYIYLIIVVFVVLSVISLLLNDFFLIPLFFCVIPCIGSYRNQRTRNAEQQAETPEQPVQEYREEGIHRDVVHKKGTCYNCGNIISKENLRFCEHCGARL